MSVLGLVLITKAQVKNGESFITTKGDDNEKNRIFFSAFNLFAVWL